MTLFSGMEHLPFPQVSPGLNPNPNPNPNPSPKPFPQGETGYDHHSNFDNIYRSMQTVFQLLTGDAWAGFYLDAREVRFPADKYQLSPAWVTLYFVFFLCTMLMLTSVFVAIIVKNYSIQRSLSIDQETVANFSDVWLRYDAKVTG